jgi:hypothetical protein
MGPIDSNARLMTIGVSAGKNRGAPCDVNYKTSKSATSMELEQNHIIKFLHLKNLKSHEITVRLSGISSQDERAPPSIKYWIHQIDLERTDPQLRHVGGRLPLDDFDTAIPSILRRFPLSSVGTIADAMNVPALTIYICLLEKVRLKQFILR